MAASCTFLLGKLQEVNIIARVRGGKVAVGMLIKRSTWLCLGIGMQGKVTV
jgi:hypothetical protein